ncbi:DUF7269 family protein [Halobaculum rarum]|uniref:DUF7269 family protein n=1 Tax=Halobaculum rarum TaxID=3075122 RepID=UPI0032AFEB5E
MSTRERGWEALVWRAIRGLLLATGLAVFAVGLLAVVDPETGERLPVESAVRALGSDYVVVAAVGLLAMGLSALVVGARRLRGVDEATPPVVEGVQSATYPGESVDRSPGRLRRLMGGGAAEDDRRERLRAAATRATMRADGCSRDVAERRVAEGDWTDDPVASRTLSGPGRRSDRARRRRLDDDAVGRTVDAIERLTDDGSGRRGEGESPSGTGR